MSDNSPFLILDQPCEAAVDWVAGRISRAGLKVVRTFDLKVARQAQVVCPCPHHGTDQCDCQMLVMMVYEVNRLPVTLVAHGYNGQTWFSVVDTPQQRADPRIEATIRRLVALPSISSANLENHAHPI